MELIAKRFEELTVNELYDIYKLRVSVFVVEQNCPYQEVDEADKHACHLYLKDESGILAYLRVLPAGVVHEEVSIGRVIAVKRRCGLGTKIVRAGIAAAKERLGAQSIFVSAQTYARAFYEGVGFTQVGEGYLEDDIPHIPMRLLL